MVDEQTRDDLLWLGFTFSPVAFPFIAKGVGDVVGDQSTTVNATSNVEIEPFGRMNLEVSVTNDGNMDITPAVQPTIVTPDNRQLKLKGKWAPNTTVSPGESYSVSWSDIERGCSPQDQNSELLFDQEGDYGLIIAVWNGGMNTPDFCHGQRFQDNLLTESFPDVITVNKNSSASLADVTINGTSIK